MVFCGSLKRRYCSLVLRYSLCSYTWLHDREKTNLIDKQLFFKKVCLSLRLPSFYLHRVP